jgi:acyl-CoA thioester hydrolase
MAPNRQFNTFRGLVYPSQCDAMGHMNVQYYIAAFDQAMWHLVHELGYRKPAGPNSGHGWADVRHVVEYHRELPAGALYRVTSNIEKVGRSSLVTRHRMFEMESGELAAECEMTSVYFDLVARAGAPLPQSLGDTARALLPDHASGVQPS